MKLEATKRRPKGANNDIIRAAIRAGLRLENGQVILPSGKAAPGTKTAAGYYSICLGPPSDRCSFTRGRIVCWLAHGEPPTEQHQADHINLNRADDRPENLRWVTPSENARNISEESRKRVARNGLHLPHPKGFAHHQSLPREKVEQIRSVSGKTQGEIGEMFGVTQSTVSRIRRGVRYLEQKEVA